MMRRQSFGFWLGTILLALPLLAAAPPDTLQQFVSPEAAIDTLVAAVRANDATQLRALFGQAGLQVVSAGDPVADAALRQKFITAYDARHAIDVKGDAATLSIGTDDWPFPIPLKHAAQGWSSDVAAGREEILDRRIGANELYVQQVVLAYVDAQNEYFQGLHDGHKIHLYAQHLMSSPGKQDGLYWPTEGGQPQSPLGPLVAEARTEATTRVRTPSGSRITAITSISSRARVRTCRAARMTMWRTGSCWAALGSLRGRRAGATPA